MTDTIRLPYGTRHATSLEVESEVRARVFGPERTEIPDSVALAIASYWQAPIGHGRTFAQLSTTGTVDVEALLDAISSEYAEALRQGDMAARELDCLATWAIHHPSRES